jgi:hypothetical protein
LGNNKKLNEGCLKIFYFLKLLYEDKAFYADVREIFKDDISQKSPNHTQVILNKYINALKVFGIKVVKSGKKYVLQNSIYSMHFTLDDLKSISILASTVKNFPETKLNENITEFLHNIRLRMNRDDKISYCNITQTKNYNFTFQYLDLKKQIEQCQKLCQTNHAVNIVYLNNGKETHVKGAPEEIIYDVRNAYFKVYDIKARQSFEIPLTNILKLEESPQIAKPNTMSQTVVFKVKNRLAQNYRLKENEYSEGFDDEGNQIIINKNEPFDKLLKRLMRYSTNCEIISPKQLRYKFIELINRTLSMYK